MGQGNNHLALVCFSQLSDDVLCELQEVDVLAKLFVERVKSVNPLFLSQTEESYLYSVHINYLVLKTLC